jgi:hypothetical protein
MIRDLLLARLLMLIIRDLLLVRLLMIMIKALILLLIRLLMLIIRALILLLIMKRLLMIAMLVVGAVVLPWPLCVGTVPHTFSSRVVRVVSSFFRGYNFDNFFVRVVVFVFFFLERLLSSSLE